MKNKQMSNKHSKLDPEKSPQKWQNFSQQVGAKVTRKIRAMKEKKNIWYALGMFGMVGWSVAVPALMGIAIGIWIDTHTNSPYSWTLMLLIGGLILGCFNAWFWIQQESQIEPMNDHDNDE